MGGGTWSSVAYNDTTKSRLDAGVDVFTYSADTMSSPRDTWTVHDDLDPKKRNSFGDIIRESRDSDEHPESLPITVLFDVTGSMREIPKHLVKKLPELLGLVLRKGYAEHPQILFGALGDATCDRVPLQVGQFESDNRMDSNLENFVLEGGGGGHITESYELAAYFMDRHSAHDSWEKRGHKGYLFFVGDEIPYPTVSAAQVQQHIDDGLEADVPTAEVFESLQERYNVFYILPTRASHGKEQRILDAWREYLGQNVLELDDVNAVCETIALTVGLCEGSIDLDAGTDDLRNMGVDSGTIRSASTAVATVPQGTAVAKSTGALPGMKADSTSGATRI